MSTLTVLGFRPPPSFGRIVRALEILSFVLTFIAMPVAAFAKESDTPTQVDVLDKIIAQEQAEMESLRKYSPLVETYIQIRRQDKHVGVVLAGDKYFLGRAMLAKGVKLEPLAHDTRTGHNWLSESFANFFSMEFLPRGFLQMIYLDMNGFDRSHYKFHYVRREFLGEVRCLVFDVDPRVKAEKGRFVGRIWVEDQGFHIVRFNGIYNGSSILSYYFSFDSWRQNDGKNEWMPAVIYCEEGNAEYPMAKGQMTPAFRAQTRLWGYALDHAQEEQEMTRVLVEAPGDQTEGATDYSPLQANRLWTRQAEDNVIASLEKVGLMAPYGEVDKTLEAVVSNLQVSNGLDIQQPQVRCRVLTISTFESLAMGRTIVLSRGLLDVLPDEASLAALLAHELGHIVLGHGMNTQFAFFDRIRFDEKNTFRHFALSRPPEEELAANQKGLELLMNSPYKDQLATAQFFLRALQSRSKEIPNLISPHLGDRMPTNWTIASTALSVQAPKGKAADMPATASIVALPLGGRIKVDPFSNQLHFLNSKSVGLVSETERMPFEVTPAFLYLTPAK